MSIRLPPLVPDLVLDTRLASDVGVDLTVHAYTRSDPSLGRRLQRVEEHWQRDRMLGSGGFGTVWLERCVAGERVGTLRAVKEIRREVGDSHYAASSAAASVVSLGTVVGSGLGLGSMVATSTGISSAAAECARELEAIAKFSQRQYRHCFVRSYGWFENERYVFVAMEYLQQGDLQRYIDAGTFRESEARAISKQLLEGVAFMHGNGFAHRDLKPKVCWPIACCFLCAGWDSAQR